MQKGEKHSSTCIFMRFFDFCEVFRVSRNFPDFPIFPEKINREKIFPENFPKKVSRTPLVQTTGREDFIVWEMTQREINPVVSSQ